MRCERERRERERGRERQRERERGVAHLAAHVIIELAGAVGVKEAIPYPLPRLHRVVDRRLELKGPVHALLRVDVPCRDGRRHHVAVVTQHVVAVGAGEHQGVSRLVPENLVGGHVDFADKFALLVRKKGEKKEKREKKRKSWGGGRAKWGENLFQKKLCSQISKNFKYSYFSSYKLYV